MTGLLASNTLYIGYEVALYAGELALRVIPLLIVAVFLAESVRLWLGDEKLRFYLAGRHSWTGRLRALVLGAVLPFCECGAFPIMLGLIRAGIPAGVVLTFFLVSPVVSMPAFMILIGVFGLPLAIVYLVITSGAALAASFLLERSGKRWEMFKDGIIVDDDISERANLAMAGGAAGCDINRSGSCRKDVAKQSSHRNNKFAVVAGMAWGHTLKLLKRVSPYVVAVILLSSLLRNLVPQDLIVQTLEARAPFDVLIGALVGVPVYSGDCAMIALVAPLMGATGAVGAGIAFIISGSGTSINGIVFMSSVFKRGFLVLYVLTVFCIALIVGYLISIFLALGLV